MHMLIDDNHKLIYFWSPKAGCSTLKLFFAAMNNIPLPSPIHVHLVVDQIQESIQKSIVIERKRYEDYQKLLIIREPHSRFVSTFISYNQHYDFLKLIELPLELFIKNLAAIIYLPTCIPPLIPEIIRNLMINFKDKPSFKNFARIVEKIGNDSLNHHIGAQLNYYLFCIYPEIMETQFDKLIKLDFLTEELDKIAKSFGKNVEIKSLNRAEYNPELEINISDMDLRVFQKDFGLNFPKWVYFLDDEIKGIIRRLFAKDIELYDLNITNENKNEFSKKIRNIMQNP